MRTARRLRRRIDVRLRALVVTLHAQVLFFVRHIDREAKLAARLRHADRIADVRSGWKPSTRAVAVRIVTDAAHDREMRRRVLLEVVGGDAPGAECRLPRVTPLTFGA